VSNFPLSYKLSWLPRLLNPSLVGRDDAFGPIAERWMAPARSVRLVFLGDISAVANREAPEIDPTLRAVIASADLVVANCESPVVERAEHPVGTRFGLRHAMTPSFLDAVMVACGMEPGRLLLSLANNHILDQGERGFAETVAALQARGIGTAGSVGYGTMRRVDVGGISIDFAAFTLWRNASAALCAGRVSMSPEIAVPEGAAADLTCALPHWDLEFRHFPQSGTRLLARELAQAGASLIVGGHAHVLQPVERIGGAFVAYGLGDFLGTALPRVPPALKLGALLEVEVSAEAATRGQVVAYRVVPFVRQGKGRHERLEEVSPDDRLMAARLAALFSG